MVLRLERHREKVGANATKTGLRVRTRPVKSVDDVKG